MMRISKVIARAWKDPAFKKKLIANPKQTLKEMGIVVPDRFNVKVIEDQPNTFTLVIPSGPTNAEVLDEETLTSLAGGWAATAPAPCP